MNRPSPYKPPKWSLRFFRWIIRPEYLEEIEGDMEEVFHELLEAHSLAKAKRKYAFEAFKLCRISLLKPIFPTFFSIHTAMIKHNFLITYRSFLRNKSSFLINLTGLSTGLACVLMIYLWVQDELSVDSFLDSDKQLYQVRQNLKMSNQILSLDNAPYLLAEAMETEFPEVVSAVAVNDDFCDPEGIIAYQDQSQKAKVQFARENFFQELSYKLILGNKKEVLAGMTHVAISETFAYKFFSTPEDAIGKTLKWNYSFDGGTYEELLVITGVFESPPKNATKQFDAVVHFDLLIKADRWAGDWSGTYAEVYLNLKKGTNIDQFNQKIASYLNQKHPSKWKRELFVRKYADRHLYGAYENGIQTGGRIAYVNLFSIIALFILFIACINFMNLSTAQATLKMKQIGVKKTIGASRKILIGQFLSESLLITLISAILAIMLVALLLPQFNQLTGKYLSLSFSPTFITGFIAITLFTGFIAGSYPAFYLSSIKPLSILKGKLNASRRELWVRKGLVVFQFGLSVIFIVGVWVIQQQMKYTQTKNLGFNRDHVISFHMGSNNKNPKVFLTALQQIPGVSNSGNISGSFMSGLDNQGGYSWEEGDDDKKILFQSPRIGYNAIETLGLKVVAGRSFSPEFKDDASKLILNESAVKLMGLENPVGTLIDHGPRTQEVIGVVSDFHYGSIHKKIEPLILRFREGGRTVMAKITTENSRATIEQIKTLYEEFQPGFPFEYKFLDEEYQQLYEAESKVAMLSKYFSGLAILISCLGLFGLAAFTAERRTREIGIRKILGSSVWGIVRLLSADFTKMVVIAILIALPVSYLLASNWLESFAYRIDLQWWYFVGAAVLTLVIAWLTVSIQTLKAANINPAECLKDE